MSFFLRLTPFRLSFLPPSAEQTFHTLDSLVGIDVTDESIVPMNEFIFEPNGSNIPSSTEIDQVHRDVNRCTHHLLTKSQRHKLLEYKQHKKQKSISSLLKQRQSRLDNLINIVLRDARGTLRYYQGYHDVSSIILSVLGTQEENGLGLAKAVLLQISRSHFRDATKHNFQSLTSAIRIGVMPLLHHFDRQLHSHLQESGIEPFFVLSWIITWFSHDVRDTRLVKRLFDAFLAAHPSFALYLSVAMVLHPVNRETVMETECDFASLHTVLSSLPRNSFGEGEGEDGGVNGVKWERGGEMPKVPFQELIDMAISYM